MFDKSNKQSQFELFPGGSSEQSDDSTAHNPFIFRGLTLSLDNIIVLCIIFIISLVVFFSFGVERGKRVVKKEMGIKEVAAVEPQVDLEVEAQDTKAQIHKISITEKSAPKESVSPAVEDKREVLEIDIQEEYLYTIQVASFKRRANAQKEADSLKVKGHETFVSQKGSYSIVCVGKFPQKSDAKTYTAKLDRRYSDYLIRRM